MQVSAQADQSVKALTTQSTGHAMLQLRLTAGAYSDKQLHTHTHTQPFNGPWSGTTRVGRYQKKNTHPLIPILIIGHPLSTSSIYYDPLCSVYMLDSPL